ncbi:hypothetical protein BEP19_15885 [Ammoniphilus oxalaticus]|uniref:HK97 gp10 family phage protein n=1 Tax=Ammoniphilus oxalaticus TaxID=66863 RepID=A0A419SQL6_9BACL|nr:HK97 gp10 family phage protein [Ammoniphilus oxalaticus]RKD26687.1 hypothetical protein BEP19_15885 [Ammoniphilus oxalaticus]
MPIEFEGLSEFQKDLLELAQETLPRETNRIMGRIGTRATTHVRREARAKVGKNGRGPTGNYYKRIKRGRVFKDKEGKIVTRVINSAPHAHLIEYGHKQVTKDGREVGFVPGKHVMSNGAKNFDNSGDFEKMLSDWLDEMLDSKGL